MTRFPSVFGVRWGVFAMAVTLFFNTVLQAQVPVPPPPPPPRPNLDLLQRQSDMLWQQLDFWWPYMRVSQTERITQIIRRHSHCMDIAQYISYNIQRPVPVHVLADAWLNKVRMAAANLRNEYYMNGPRQLQYLRDLEFFLVNAIPAVNFYIAAVSDAYLVRGRTLPALPGFLPPGYNCPQTAQRTLDVAIIMNQLRFLMCDVINLVRQLRGGTIIVVTNYRYVVPVQYYDNLIRYYQGTNFTYGMQQAWVPPQVGTIPFQAPQGQDFYVPNQAPERGDFTQPQLTMPEGGLQPQFTQPMPVQPQGGLQPQMQPGQMPMQIPQGGLQGQPGGYQPVQPQGGYQPQPIPQQQPVPQSQPGVYFPQVQPQPQGLPTTPGQVQPPQQQGPGFPQQQPGQIPPLSNQRGPVRVAPGNNFPR